MKLLTITVLGCNQGWAWYLVSDLLTTGTCREANRVSLNHGAGELGERLKPLAWKVSAGVTWPKVQLLPVTLM